MNTTPDRSPNCSAHAEGIFLEVGSCFERGIEGLPGLIRLSLL